LDVRAYTTRRKIGASNTARSRNLDADDAEASMNETTSFSSVPYAGTATYRIWHSRVRTSSFSAV
jgi:hypothetical protein